MNAAFWQGKRVFVTGHTGFKGSWLCLLLAELGAQVRGFALPPPSEPSLFRLAALETLVDSLEGDVREPASLAAALTDFQPDVVFHLAAQALVRASYRDPIATYATNVLGTVHLLDAVRRAESVQAVVNVTSDKCYRNVSASRAFEEQQPLGGHDPYSNSKACAELVSEAFRASYFSAPDARVALATARAGNVIGGGDWAEDRLIPDIVRCCLAGRSVEIRNPAAIRPWQHVLEPLSAYLLLAERLCDSNQAFAEAWNFGPRVEDARPVAEVVELVVRLWGEPAAWHCNSAPQPHEAATLRLDCTKARTRLGWQPQLSLGTALRWTIDWYRRQAAGDDARELTLDQIRAFRRLDDDSATEHNRRAAA